MRILQDAPSPSDIIFRIRCMCFAVIEFTLADATKTYEGTTQVLTVECPACRQPLKKEV